MPAGAVDYNDGEMGLRKGKEKEMGERDKARKREARMCAPGTRDVYSS